MACAGLMQKFPVASSNQVSTSMGGGGGGGSKGGGGGEGVGVSPHR